jgi:TFIIF-interacting CTD phosphatase-like protein
MFLFLRPGLFDFLDTLYKHFELVLFNNDKKEYTEQIVKAMMQ